jgi:hypothetical protein
MQEFFPILPYSLSYNFKKLDDIQLNFSFISIYVMHVLKGA